MILWGKKVLLKEIPLPSAPPFSMALHCTERQRSPVISELEMKIWKCNLGFLKIPISHLFYELGKTWKYTQSRPTFQNPIQMLNLWMSKENLCPNLSLTVENKMENSHKKGWSHFKHNINDWGIPFPKMLRVCQWIGKNIFHWGKWNEPIKLIKECVRLKIKT